jgi:hypothetical protein
MRSRRGVEINENFNRPRTGLHRGTVTAQMQSARRISVIDIGQVIVRGKLEQPRNQRNNGKADHPLTQASV